MVASVSPRPQSAEDYLVPLDGRCLQLTSLYPALHLFPLPDWVLYSRACFNLCLRDVERLRELVKHPKIISIVLTAANRVSYVICKS